MEFGAGRELCRQVPFQLAFKAGWGGADFQGKNGKTEELGVGGEAIKYNWEWRGASNKQNRLTRGHRGSRGWTMEGHEFQANVFLLHLAEGGNPWLPLECESGLIRVAVYVFS